MSKRNSASKQPRSKKDLSQFGIFTVPDLDDLDDDEDDAELEAELLAIISPGSGKSKAKKKNQQVALPNLDLMVAESLRDIPSDMSSGDEDDPSLLAELQAFTGENELPESPMTAVMAPTLDSVNVLSLLNERIQMYKQAESNAQESGDTSKARRLGRGLKTLNELVQKAQAGKQIDENDIPLPVTVSIKKTVVPAQPSSDEIVVPEYDDVKDMPPPIPPRIKIPTSPSTNEDKEDILKMLTERRDEYKKAAVVAKRAGDLETAKAHVKIIKQFEAVISSAQEGQTVDLSTMPPPPSSLSSLEPSPTLAAPVPQIVVESEIQKEPQTEPTSNLVLKEEDNGGIPEPTSILEALEQRLEVFKKQEETAKNEGNSSKARRMGRISKQYVDAIRLHNAGKEIPVEDLPTPPGFPPIPVEKKAPPSPGPIPSPDKTENKPTVSPKPKPAPSPQPSPPVPQSNRVTRQEKQLTLLLKRQKECKEAALAAKKSGDITKAKEFLRQVKGIEQLIEASRSGLPVDLSTIPVAPQDKLSENFEVVKLKDCIPGTNAEIYQQLKSDLKRQFEMSIETKNHYKTLGDVANSNMFEQLAVNTKKDLDRVIVLDDRDDPIPRFHYEMRAFSIVKANTDLNDNDLELSIMQGINYNVPNPKEIDTYVKYEFPYPSEDIKKDKTSTIYNTNNPSYSTTFIIPIIRTNRSCQRVFKRHSLKLEVWSKGGFLRSDTLVGTVNIKLQPLETKCTIHDSFNLMDGRKPLGGKLEVKIRLRHPIQAKEMQTVQEKWLIID